ncbi:MAG: histidinol-phosphate transaminase [Azoarcus sp.]|jgi:histidinol-phosphate aminotransferase|nr:histidinol-phosphate transaminase [Azoarcus sp.]
MSRFWSAATRGLTPYEPGEQPGVDNLVKLNTNENPYGPSPRALAAIRAAANETLRLYPDPDAGALKAALAAHHGASPAQIFVGNGSDEVLAHAFLGLLKHESPLWMPDVTYSFYPVYCGLYGIAYRRIPLAAGFTLRAEDYFPRAGERAGAIVFPNPNAPTGRLLPLAEVERIVAANPDAVVLVDEAYIDFASAEASAVALIGRHPNLLTVHTFSKSRALAGLRVGYAIGHPDLIAGLERVKNCFNSYPLDRLALAGALASVQDGDWFEESRRKVVASRAALAGQLRALGFEAPPSAANFIFARHPARDGAKLAAALRQRAIIVRHFNAPGIEQFLRITVGDDKQCAALIAALREILQTDEESIPIGRP